MPAMGIGKHNKHQVILIHAKEAHANKSRGNYDLHRLAYKKAKNKCNGKNT
jgi:hypothetical protein